MAAHTSDRFPTRRGPAAGFKPRVEGLEDRWMPAADVILEWNDVMLQANAADHALAAPEQGGPVLTGRAFAIVSAAMYDAYNSIERIGDPYLVTAPVPGRSADPTAAVAQAAHDTLTALFPAQRPLFDAKLAQTLGRVHDGPREDRGRAAGAYVAQQILAARADDGASVMADPPYVSNGLPGFHSPDPLHPTQVAYGPSAGVIEPFAVASTGQFAAPRLDDGTPTGRLAFLQSPEYTAAYAELAALGGDGVTTPTQRTPEQTMIGMFWGYDGRPGLGTPPRLYNQIIRGVAAQEGNTEAENARLFALANLAMADAGFTSWNDKYVNQFWRPVMGLRYGDADGNPATVGDPTWTPLGAPASNPRPGETSFTPPFPAYTSGHATIGAAAFEVLTRFYGTDHVAFTVRSDEFNGVTRGADGAVRPAVTRSFTSFSAAMQENAQSRIYLGIHWHFDAEQGIHSGDHVADYVFDHFLQPTGHGHGNGLAAQADGRGLLDASPAAPHQEPPTPVMSHTPVYVVSAEPPKPAPTTAASASPLAVGRSADRLPDKLGVGVSQNPRAATAGRG